MRIARRPLARAYQRFLALAFVFALSAPGALLLAGRDESADIAFEFRPAAPAPRLAASLAGWGAFPRDFERYFDDRFAGRGLLLRSRARVHWYALRTCPSDAMLRGDGDWLFTTASRAIEAATGRFALSDAELDDWLDAIAARSASLAERGIVHLVAIVPDKSTVYPERLPARWSAPDDGRPAAALVARAEQRGMRQVLDLAPALREEKRRDAPGDPAYYPLGHHWCARGALAGAAAIHARLSEFGVRLAPLERERVQFGPPRDPEVDSWAGRLYLTGRLRQAFLDATLPDDLVARVVHDDRTRRTKVLQRALPDAASIAVFHDSFGENLQSFLATTARRSIWHWRSYDEAGVDELPVDAVIELCVERTFASRLPPTADPSRQEHWRGAFERAPPTAVRWTVRPVGHASAADWRRAGDDSVVLALRSPSHGFEFALDGLAPGVDHVVRLAFTAPRDGELYTRYAWRSGPAAYPAESSQREVHRVAAGDGDLHVVLARQRIGDELLLGAKGEPMELVVRDVEVRALTVPIGATRPER